MLLAYKQMYGSTEQMREPRNKPICQWSINLQQRKQKNIKGKRKSLQQLVWESWTPACKSMKLGQTLT